MSYYKTCPHCGAHLDPGEVCECVKTMYQRLTPENKKRVNETIDTLLAEQKRSRPGAANAGDGKVEQINHAVSASIVSENEEDCKMNVKSRLENYVFPTTAEDFISFQEAGAEARR